MTSPEQSFDVLAIDELVRPLVIAAGLELWDVEANPQVVRVLVDRIGGIDLESLTPVARAISEALDARDDVAPGSRYQLEVSSPGVERVLRTPGHFQRFVGATVAVKTAAPVEGSRRLQGVLRAAGEAGITVEAPGGALDLSYDQIQKAHTVLVWGPAAKKPAGHKARGSGPAAAGDPSERIKDVAR